MFDKVEKQMSDEQYFNSRKRCFGLEELSGIYLEELKLLFNVITQNADKIVFKRFIVYSFL